CFFQAEDGIRGDLVTGVQTCLFRSKKDGTALDFPALLKLADKHAVRFPKTMTCLNIGCPLGTGIWEGVPLRELIWLTRPRENLRSEERRVGKECRARGLTAECKNGE